MKKLLAVLAITIAVNAQAQKVVSKAIVTTKTEMEFPEQNQPAGGDDGGNRMMMPRDMEITSTIFFKEDQTKMENTTDFGKNYVFIDRKAKRTTTLMEMMGKKQGFWSSDEDQAKMQKRMDSVRAARADSLKQLGITFAPPAEPEITYTDEKKKIAGMECKKAIIKTKNQRGEVNETAVWYTPEFVMADGFSLTSQGGGGMRMMGFNPSGIEKIKGFPMEYEIVRQNGMRIHMTVIKVQLDADIDDKTFEIPKGYDIKPMSEMQNQGGRMMMRMGGGN
jgi:GLPGLI family protein